MSRPTVLLPFEDRLLNGRSYDGGADGAERHEARVDPTSADQPLPAPITRPTRRAEHLRFSNGLSVVLWPYGTTPLVRGTLVVHSGWVNEPLGKEGITELVGGNGVVTPDHFIFDAAPHLVSRSNDLVRSLTTMLQADLHMRLRADSKQRIHETLLHRWAITKYDLEQRTTLYGPNHAYARSSMTDDTPEAIDEGALTSWIDRHMGVNNATLIVTGQFDPAQIKQDIVTTTELVRSGGRWRDIAGEPRPMQPRPVQAWITSKRDEPSSSLQLEVAFVGGRGIDADHAKRLVLEAVLTEKLFELRQRRGLPYVSWANYKPRRAGGLWSLGAVVDSSRAVEAGAMLAQLLEQLRRDPESYRVAFVLARQKVLERLLASSGSSRQILAQLVELVRFDLDETSYDQRATDVAALTLSTFHPFVAHELAETGQVFGAIGNTAAVDAALDAAKHANNAK